MSNVNTFTKIYTTLSTTSQFPGLVFVLVILGVCLSYVVVDVFVAVIKCCAVVFAEWDVC